MRNILHLSLILFALNLQADKQAPETLSYFEKISFGSEFGNSKNVIQKWNVPIKIYVMGKSPDHLSKELKKVVSELNELIKPIKVSITNKAKNSNFTICLGSAKDYIKIEKYAAKYTQQNWGLFFIYSDKKKNIYKGSMYVDIYRCKNKDAQKHLLREELTQALGLMKDCNDFQDSIFYGRWKPHTTNFSPLDKKIIRLLYSKKINAGMTQEEFRQAFGIQ